MFNSESQRVKNIFIVLKFSIVREFNVTRFACSMKELLLRRDLTNNIELGLEQYCINHTCNSISLAIKTDNLKTNFFKVQSCKIGH